MNMKNSYYLSAFSRESVDTMDEILQRKEAESVGAHHSETSIWSVNIGINPYKMPDNNQLFMTLFLQKPNDDTDVKEIADKVSELIRAVPSFHLFTTRRPRPETIVIEIEATDLDMPTALAKIAELAQLSVDSAKK